MLRQPLRQSCLRLAAHLAMAPPKRASSLQLSCPVTTFEHVQAKVVSRGDPRMKRCHFDEIGVVTSFGDRWFVCTRVFAHVCTRGFAFVCARAAHALCSSGHAASGGLKRNAGRPPPHPSPRLAFPPRNHPHPHKPSRPPSTSHPGLDAHPK